MTKGSRNTIRSCEGFLPRLKDGILKKIAPTIGILLTGLLLAGSAANEGVGLFENGDYREAQQVLGDLLAKQPEVPEAQFYMGRIYLALEDAEQALPYLTRAVALDPDKATYHFWLGVAYWALLDLDRELAAYEKALAIDPDFLPAHVYAGHNQLDRGHWPQALGHYESVLEEIPDHPEALYNAGRALDELGRTAEAVDCWQRYLEHHRRGSLAVGAVRQLNAAGNFSYRAYPVGKRFVVGPSPGFRDGTTDIDPEMAATLDDIGRLVQPLDQGMLHIVAFVKNDQALAAERAKTLKRYLRDRFPNIPSGRIRTSWFGEAETMPDHPKRVELKASLKLFTAP
jgi:tetratricopeptide (TPR) repeat protein